MLRYIIGTNRVLRSAGRFDYALEKPARAAGRRRVNTGPVVDSITPREVASAGVIATDLSCKRCGYNLRGLPETGRCPECAAPIGLAIRGNLLRFSDPDWVARVAHGLRILVWAMVLWVVAVVAAAALAVLAHPVYAHLFTLAVSALAFYGTWLVTLPDPSGFGEDPHMSARKAIRIALVFGMLSDLAEVFAEAFPSRPTVVAVLGAIGVLAALVWMWGEFAKFSYCAVLARRVPDESLVSRARWIKWGYTLSLGVLVVLGGVMALVVVLGGLAVAPATAPARIAVYSASSEVETGGPDTSPAEKPAAPAQTQPVSPPAPQAAREDSGRGAAADGASHSRRVRGAISVGSARAVVAPGAARGGAPAVALSPGAIAVLTASGCVTSVASIAFLVYAILAFFLFRRLAQRISEQAEAAKETWQGTER